MILLTARGRGITKMNCTMARRLRYLYHTAWSTTAVPNMPLVMEALVENHLFGGASIWAEGLHILWLGLGNGEDMG